MGKKVFTLGLMCILVLCVQGRADFKYAESSQITGGALAGVMHFMGHFSKQANQPMATTTYVKGDYLRKDNSDGSYQIIDLNGKRMIQVYPAKRTYSVTTFEQLRQMAQAMVQAFRQGAHNQAQQNNTQVTLTPKIEVTPTGQTQVLLGQNTQEVTTKVDLNIQATDTQNGTQSGTLSTNVDSWVAPSVSGYKEVSDFNKKMATEIGWTPGNVGMDPRMQNAMVQLYKSGKIPQGLPMLEVTSLLTTGQPAGQANQQQQQQQEQSSTSSNVPTTPNAAAMKALGGMFGHFGHRKKKNQDEEQQQTDQSSTSSSDQSGSKALMEITTRVVSYSTDSLDGSLFQIPAGFAEIPSNFTPAMSGRNSQ
jgi:hypothetical protein